MHPKIKKAIPKVFNEFAAIPPEEFRKMSKEHIPGDICLALRQIWKDEEMIRRQEAHEILKPTRGNNNKG